VFPLRQLLTHNVGDADKLKERLKRCEERLKQSSDASFFRDLG